MTCIVALRNGEDIILGADRCTSFGDSIITATESKITEREIKIMGKNDSINVFMALAGYSVHSSFLKYGFDIPEYDNSILFKKYLYKSFLPEFKKQLEENGLLKIEDSKSKLEGCFLIIFENKIYKIGDNLGLIDVSSLDYYSIGSGSYHAEGSLYSIIDMGITPKEKVKIAIKAAAHHLSSVDENIDIEIIKPTDYIRCDNRNNKETKRLDKSIKQLTKSKQKHEAKLKQLLKEGGL